MSPRARSAAARVGPVAPMEVWAGFECTINRVADRQHDQCAFTGHYDRLDDLDRVAALGIRTVRYPILWERIAGSPCEEDAWRWTDLRMARMRELGLDPIVGLVHHGSGPRHTSLLHDDFAGGLAEFAGRVADRYPWVTRYTPINEPLTTARFSVLYGLWYPHRRDMAAMFRAMLNQTRATRLAMAAIRTAAPAAQLVQTEDLGRAHSTPLLAYQAEMENERRWLTVDLLTGMLRPGHAMHEMAMWAGVTDDEITDAVGDGCAPDVVGINTYVTSERWLDDRLERYPLCSHGDNGRHRYADVEAVRARPEGMAGHESLLMEAWRRYGLPMAVTETHMGGTREQQMRWFLEAWDAGHRAREAGADLRAITAWAVLGLQDWSSLVTRLNGDYEPGLFDVRAPVPRATALATMVRDVAATGSHDHPVLAESGWWRRADRLVFAANAEPAPKQGTSPLRPLRARPVLVVGATGTLGSAMVRLCDARGLSYRAIRRDDVDASDATEVQRLLRQTGAWAVVNAAGYVRVDDAERDVAGCHLGNVDLAVGLARGCAAEGVPLVTFSSDLVFDGDKGAPYVESDRTAPLNVYGESKVLAEQQVLARHAGALVVRTAAFFGLWDEWNFVTRTLAELACGREVSAASDLAVSPTFVPDLGNAALDLLIDGEFGVWHLATAGEITWAGLARMAADAAGLDASLVHERPHREMGFAARRPTNVTLASERGWVMPALDHALERYVRERPWRRLAERSAAEARSTTAA